MKERFAQNFEIPDVGVPYLDLFFSEQEQWLGAVLGKEPFTKEDLAAILASSEAVDKANASDGWVDDPGTFLEKSYQNGFLSYADKEAGIYCLNNFYRWLDIFAIIEKEKYDTLTSEEKHALDDWYFDEYCSRLDLDSDFPTGDKVYLLDEMLEYIDNHEDQIYLNHCNCRRLTGDCGLPTYTCLTYWDVPNTYVDRGYSKKLTKEEAKQVVIDADKAGLMHSANEGGICNCCGDCCYLFRAYKRSGKPAGSWPPAAHIVSIDESKCVACGKCTKRCHYGVFEIVRDEESGKAKLKADTTKCVGCGVCNPTCPGNALTMVKRM